MALQTIKLKVNLTISGPILCSATGMSSWGIDSVFITDYKNDPYIPKSHIKGKLREAFSELDKSYQIDLNYWFGDAKPENEYGPGRGHLYFSHFFPLNWNHNSKRIHRIRIHPETGTADEGALITIKTPFPSGSISNWEGFVEFIEDYSKTDEMVNRIKQAFLWITAIGANKGIGYGIIKKIDFDLVCTPINYTPKILSKKSICLGVKIIPKEPVAIGGVRRKDNYLESVNHFSGSTLKGAMATSINRHIGKNSNLRLNYSELLPSLTKNFEQLRFTHAYPGLKNKNKRPVVIPFSAVDIGSEFKDVVFEEKAIIADSGDSPAFFHDWKDDTEINKLFGHKDPMKISITRTEIESESRRAKEEKLFTFEYLCPIDYQENELAWYSNIYIPKSLLENEEEFETLLAELKLVCSNWWNRLGKQNAEVDIELNDDFYEPILPTTSVEKEKPLILTLQSDTLMLNPFDVKPDISKEGFKSLYKNYWEEISGGSLEMVNFFAAQALAGGYIAKRYRKDLKSYYPYYLTSAGSTFLFKIIDFDAAKVKINDWMLKGLQIPQWALDEYGDGNKLHYNECPFIPENGFGEIIPNLKWHWDKKIR